MMVVEMVGEKAVKEVSRLRDYAEVLESRLELAKQVIKRHLDVLSPEELERLVLAGILHPMYVPHEKRTNAIERFVQLMSVAKSVAKDV